MNQVYRAWLSDPGEWLTHVFLDEWGDLHMAIDGEEPLPLSRDDYVLEYSTGFQNISGEPIFAGDLVECQGYPFYGDAQLSERNYIGEVGIDNEGAYYNLHVVSDRVMGRAVGGALSDRENWITVGNIHENGALLEVKVS